MLVTRSKVAALVTSGALRYYTVLQLENRLNPHASGSVPSPVPGHFPGFTITITHSG